MTHAMNCISEPDYSSVRVEDIGCAVFPEIKREVTRFLDEVTTAL